MHYSSLNRHEWVARLDRRLLGHVFLDPLASPRLQLANLNQVQTDLAGQDWVTAD